MDPQIPNFPNVIQNGSSQPRTELPPRRGGDGNMGYVGNEQGGANNGGRLFGNNSNHVYSGMTPSPRLFSYRRLLIDVMSRQGSGGDDEDMDYVAEEEEEEEEGVQVVVEEGEDEDDQGGEAEDEFGQDEEEEDEEEDNGGQLLGNNVNDINSVTMSLNAGGSLSNNGGQGDGTAAPPDDGEYGRFRRGEVDGLFCSICLDAWTSGGDHQVCCLPCGHIYGLSCIKKWMERPGSKKCPQCMRRCRVKDIRLLYASQIVSIDGELQKKVQSLEAKCAFLEKQSVEMFKKEEEWKYKEDFYCKRIQHLEETKASQVEEEVAQLMSRTRSEQTNQLQSEIQIEAWQSLSYYRAQMELRAQIQMAEYRAQMELRTQAQISEYMAETHMRMQAHFADCMALVRAHTTMFPPAPPPPGP